VTEDLYRDVPERALTRFWILYPYTTRVGGSDPGFGIAYAERGSLHQFLSGLTWDRATRMIRDHNRRLGRAQKASR